MVKFCLQNYFCDLLEEKELNKRNNLSPGHWFSPPAFTLFIIPEAF
jgi:hypothetical protein